MNRRHAGMRRGFLRIVTACLVLLAASPSAAQVPAGGAGTVTLPLAEYDRLLDRAAHPPALPPLAPVPSLLARAELAVRAGADTVRGTVTVQGEVWRDGIVKVPLLQGGTLIDAAQDGAAVPLLAEAAGVAALVRGPSPFSITLTWGAELSSEPGRAVAMLPAVRAGSVRATVDLPGDNTDVRVERGIVSARSSAGGRTIVGITMEPGTPCRVSWSSRESVASAPREVRLVSDVKTLVTVAENETRVGALVDVTVTQGEPETLAVIVPDGFEVAAISGTSVESEGVRDGKLRLAVREPARRRHRFLLALERSSPAPAAHVELTTPALDGAQREVGEVAIEATSTVELTAAESGPLRRLDVSEVGDSLVSLARSPLLAAFRYQRRDAERVKLAFDVKRFADAPVLSAAAELAEVTTLVTSEGRGLTEVLLTLRNRGQLFLKVGLPAGASLVSAEVAGEPVKPVEGPDGSRVPLVRPGFQPSGAYSVSFVYVSAGPPLGKKGEAALALARMDIPVELVQWELFVPDRYEVRRFDGDGLRADMAGPIVTADEGNAAAAAGGGVVSIAPAAVQRRMDGLGENDVGGFCVDAEGAVIPGASVTVQQGGWSRSVVTDAAGAFVVRQVPAGALTVRADLPGFVPATYRTRASGVPILLTLQVGAMTETVIVEAATVEAERQRKADVRSQAASQNVLNLQRRVSGVLPVRIDVPRAGHSYVLVRPLVLDETTTVKFEYRTR